MINGIEINSNSAPKPVGSYPHARKIGNLLFLSGIGPRKRKSSDIPGVTLDKDGKVISYDIETQCHSVFQNVKLVLESSSAKWHNLVDVTVFLTNIKKDFDVYNRIYSAYFNDVQPCRTTIGITALPTPISIEIKCIAYL